MSISCIVAVILQAGSPAFSWKAATPEACGMHTASLEKARIYACTGGGSGIITRHGTCVLRWGDQKKRYDLKSTTKSIGVTALGLALQDRKMRLGDKASAHHPSL